MSDSRPSTDTTGNARRGFLASKVHWVSNFLEEATGFELLVSVVMIVAGATTFLSVLMWLVPYARYYAPVLVLVALAFLIVSSFLTADWLAKGRIWLGLPSLMFVLALVFGIGMASFNFVYGYFSEITGWITKDAVRAVVGYRGVFEDAEKVANDGYAAHVVNFAETDEVVFYVAGMKRIQEQLGQVEQLGDGQSLNEALREQLEKQRNDANRRVGEIETTLTAARSELTTKRAKRLSIEQNPPIRASEAQLAQLLADVSRSVDLEHRDAATAETRNGVLFVGDPNFARVTLAKAQELLPIDIQALACGTPRADENAPIVQRKFGRGADDGGPCTIQLETLETEIANYRNALTAYDSSLIAAQRAVTAQTGIVNDRQAEIERQRALAQDAQSKIDGHSEVNIRLDTLTSTLLNQPTVQNLDVLEQQCGALVSTVGTLDELRDTVGQAECKVGVVKTAVEAVQVARKRADLIIEKCNGAAVSQSFIAAQAIPYKNNTLTAGKQLQTQLGALQTNHLSPCLDDLRSFVPVVQPVENVGPVQAIQQKSQTYIENQGWSDPFTTDLNRYLSVWSGADPKDGSRAILVAVMFLELAFFLGKLLFASGLLRSPVVAPALTVGHIEAQRLTKNANDLGDGRYELDPEVVSNIADDLLRLKVTATLDRLYENDFAKRPKRAGGPIMSATGWSLLRDAALGDAPVPVAQAPQSQEPPTKPLALVSDGENTSNVTDITSRIAHQKEPRTQELPEPSQKDFRRQHVEASETTQESSQTPETRRPAKTESEHRKRAATAPLHRGAWLSD